MSTVPTRLTTPDLVILSLFTEKDQHGYELNAELERREVRDWAGVSRPQVYYSLRKLSEQGMIRAVADASVSVGPERQVYQITDQGRQAFTEALGHEEWAEQRLPPPFLTWLALSPHASRETRERLISKRTEFLRKKITTERGHLKIVRAEAAPVAQVAELMVAYTISECESELSWLAKVRAVLLGD
jgi:DNA-binding PadR family transcriptional regulator